MARDMVKCPECGSASVVKNGTIPVTKQRQQTRVQMYLCKSCLRRFRVKGEK